MKNLNLENCFVVNVPHCKYGYSLAVYAEGCNEDTIIDRCADEDLFEDEADAEIAFAEQMAEYDYEHLKENIIIIK